MYLQTAMGKYASYAAGCPAYSPHPSSSPPSAPHPHHPPSSPPHPHPYPPLSGGLEGLQALPHLLHGPVGQALGCLHTGIQV